MMAEKRYFSATRVAMIALFSALAAVLYIFNFPLPFAFPAFLEFRFSDIPVLIGTFALGPVAGCIIVFFMVLIKLVFVSTNTFFVGDVADILVGFAFVIPAGMIYARRRSFGGALTGLAAGTLVSVAAALVINRVLLVPAYIALMFGGRWEPLIGMMTPLFPSCTQENFYALYLWAAVLPFNLLRCLVACAVTLLVYKHISRAINRLNERLRPKQAQGGETRSMLPLLLAFCGVSLVLIGLALLHYFLTR